MKAPTQKAIEGEFPADFAPRPTVIQGGIERMIACFEACRDANTGGYGGGVLKKIKSWGGTSAVTSCSPFTATVIGMMFDKNLTAPTEVGTFEPTYDNGEKPLPSRFYGLHNSFDPKDFLDAARPWFTRNGWYKKAPGGEDPNTACGSTVFYNLGYEIDPRDMRRGDLVSFDWTGAHIGERGKGHATFCWDVHLNAQGEVDCFQFLSSNFRPGVTIYTVPSTKFVALSNGEYRKTHDAPRPFFGDCQQYVQAGAWICLEGASEKAIRRSGTFKWAPQTVYDGTVCNLRTLRFWGFPPPTRPQSDSAFLTRYTEAIRLTRFRQPDSYAMGKGISVPLAVPQVTPQRLPAPQARKPDALREVSARPVAQPHLLTTLHQGAVEHALKELFEARWIDKGPGDVTVANDADTVKAIRDFQTKWDITPYDGIAGDKTTPALFSALVALWKGWTPAQHKAFYSNWLRSLKASQVGPPKLGVPTDPAAALGVGAHRPQVDHFHWLGNNAIYCASVTFGVDVKYVSTRSVLSGRIFLKEKRSGRLVTVPVALQVGRDNHAEGRFRLSYDMPVGSVWTGTLECDVGGGPLKISCDVELNIVAILPENRVADVGGWPWNEEAWPRRMRNILEELRNTPKPTSCSELWCLSTYGVKERMNSLGPYRKGTRELLYPDSSDLVPVRDGDGREYGKATRYGLWLADIEGSLKLDGRVFNIKQRGRPRGGRKPHIYTEFDPTQSLWEEAKGPWGDGSRTLLIPFRVLAINADKDTHLYFKKVYVHALDGKRLAPTGEIHNGICVVGDCGDMHPGKQFDFFKGREDVAFEIDDGLGTFKNDAGSHLPLSQIEFLDDCVAARK